MRVTHAEIVKLNLAEAVKNSLKHGIEHFPPLVADGCLSEAIDVVVAQLCARLERNYPLPVEIIGYPRKIFGVRPVVVSSLGTRALYKALVGNLEACLPKPSRGEGTWPVHRSFGLNSEGTHIVEFDIASCYEYVDHNILLEELVVRSGELETPRILVEFLSELHGRNLGLPQLWHESDILADVYLDILTRGLGRRMYEVSRFADDFRVVAYTFEDASHVIEQASELARDIGLVLSAEKTSIYVRSNLADRHETDDDILAKYFTDAAEAMAQARDFMMGDYESDDEDEDEDEITGEVRPDFAVYHQILNDWLKAANPFDRDAVTLRSRLQGLIPRVLAVLRHAEEEVDPTKLAVIVNDNHARVEAVVKYIAARMELRRRLRAEAVEKGLADLFSGPFGPENYWYTIKSIALNKRQNPWMKLWVIHAALVHESVGFSEDETSVLDWLDKQVDDRHELVRAEAAWALVSKGRRVTAKKVMALYQRATDMTRPLLAAVLSKVEDCPPGALNAVKSDGPLMKEAMEWAKKN